MFGGGPAMFCSTAHQRRRLNVVRKLLARRPISMLDAGMTLRGCSMSNPYINVTFLNFMLKKHISVVRSDIKSDVSTTNSRLSLLLITFFKVANTSPRLKVCVL